MASAEKMIKDHEFSAAYHHVNANRARGRPRRRSCPSRVCASRDRRRLFGVPARQRQSGHRSWQKRLRFRWRANIRYSLDKFWDTAICQSRVSAAMFACIQTLSLTDVNSLQQASSVRSWLLCWPQPSKDAVFRVKPICEVHGRELARELAFSISHEP